MKKLILIGFPLLLIVAAITVWISSSRSADRDNAESALQKSANKDKIQAVLPDANTSALIPGKYIDYAGGDIQQTGTTVVFFHAPWCLQCRQLEADIKDKGVPDGVTIIKVDYDTNQELRKKYGVNIRTTLVLLDKEGGVANKYVAYDEPNLDAVKRNLLQL